MEPPTSSEDHYNPVLTTHLDYLMRLRRVTGADTRLLAAFEHIPREAFVPTHLRGSAYSDTCFPLQLGQTTTRPTMIATMVKTLDVRDTHKVLEIGTGSGYATALLAHLAERVYTVDRYKIISQHARDTIQASFHNAPIEFYVQDGLRGCVAAAPFDRIIAWGRVKTVPDVWIDQLAPNGRLVVCIQEMQKPAYIYCIEKLGLRRSLEPVDPQESNGAFELLHRNDVIILSKISLYQEALPLLEPNRARIL